MVFLWSLPEGTTYPSLCRWVPRPKGRHSARIFTDPEGTKFPRPLCSGSQISGNAWMLEMESIPWASLSQDLYIYMIYTAVLIYCWYIDTNTAACMVKSMVKSCRSKASGNTTWLDTKILGMYQLCFLKKRRWPSRSWLRSSVLLDPHGSPTLLFGGKKNMLLLLSSPHVCCFNNGQS